MTLSASPIVDSGRFRVSNFSGSERIRAVVANDDALPTPDEDVRPRQMVGIDFSPIVLTGRQFDAYRMLMGPFAAMANLCFEAVIGWGKVGAILCGLDPEGTRIPIRGPKLPTVL